MRDGRVAALLEPSESAAATSTIDARGLLVLPGMVDTHVHFMDPGDAAREDFLAGSAAAALRGVTTVVEHTHGWPVTTAARLEEKRDHLRGRSHVDFGLAAHVWPDALEDLPPLWRAGAAYFKAFTCATHGVPAVAADRLLELAESLGELGAVLPRPLRGRPHDRGQRAAAARGDAHRRRHRAGVALPRGGVGRGGHRRRHRPDARTRGW